MIINIDRKNRSINLSIKAKDQAEESEAMQKLQQREPAASTGTHQSRRAAEGQAGQQERQRVSERQAR